MTALLALLVIAPPELAPPELPPLAELNRFPNLVMTETYYRELMAGRRALQAMPPSEGRDDGLQFNGRQFEAWNLLLEAHQQTAGEQRRRLILKRLRSLIGERAWKSGSMP